MSFSGNTGRVSGLQAGDATKPQPHQHAAGEKDGNKGKAISAIENMVRLEYNK